MKRRGYWGEGLPASFEIIIFSLNRYLDSNGLLQNLLLFFFSFFLSVFLCLCFVCFVAQAQMQLYRVIPDYVAGVNGQKSWEVK